MYECNAKVLSSYFGVYDIIPLIHIVYVDKWLWNIDLY